MSGDLQLNLFDILPSEEMTETDTSLSSLIPQDQKTPTGTYTSMAELTQDCENCQRCELSKSRTQVVIGRGNPHAPIMLIGEAPGQQEDETGLPFVGRSGQLLEKILESVGLNTERDVFICNVNKCRPPDNRTPTPQEIEACKPYLLEQIRLVNPRIILLTGATAVKGILKEKRSISKLRGQWLEWENRLCMPIFHPSYLLRNPSREEGSPKWLMWKDIQLVKHKLDELNS